MTGRPTSERHLQFKEEADVAVGDVAPDTLSASQQPKQANRTMVERFSNNHKKAWKNARQYIEAL